MAVSRAKRRVEQLQKQRRSKQEAVEAAESALALLKKERDGIDAEATKAETELQAAQEWLEASKQRAEQREVPTSSPEKKASLPMAWTFQGRFSGKELKKLDQLIKESETEEEVDQGLQHVKYLHGIASGALINKMWAIARDADAAAYWNISSTLQYIKTRPRLRSLKAVDYKERHSGSINWHDDGSSLMTVAVMISDPATDFDGGDFQIRNVTSTVSYTVKSRGDALVWPGWKEHRVSAVTRGTRRVVVAEFWESDTDTDDGHRPNDREEDLRTDLERVMKLDPTSYREHQQYGILRARDGNLKVGKRSLLKAIELNPMAHEAHMNLGVLHEKEHDFKRAEADYTTAANLNPREIYPWSRLGKIYTDTGNLIASKASYIKAVKIDPADGDMLFNLGKVHLDLDELKHAKSRLFACLKIDPANARAHANLGMVYVNQEDDEKAKRRFRLALKISPQDEALAQYIEQAMAR